MYRSSDLYYSTYLLTVGYTLVGIEKIQNKSFFVFSEQPSLQHDYEFTSGDALVNVRFFIDNLRLLKSKIYE